MFCFCSNCLNKIQMEISSLSNKFSKSYKIFTFTEIPADFTVRLQDQRVMEHDIIEFSCELTKANVNVKWMKNGSQLTEGDRVKFINDGNVYRCVITDARKDDVERYICVLPDGKKSKAMLQVDGQYISCKLIMDCK